MEHHYIKKIIYGLVIAAVVVGGVFMLLKMTQSPATPPSVDLRPAKEQMTATGPSLLKPEEEALLRSQMSAPKKNTTTMSEEEKARLRELMTARR